MSGLGRGVRAFDAESSKADFAYDVDELATEVGGGWQVRLYRRGNVIGSRVFPLPAELEPRAGRRRAYADAQAFAQNWLASR